MGFTQFDKPDLEFQRRFLTECTKYLNGYKRCLELGAGPLRVTLGVLSYWYEVIDVNDITNMDRIW